MVDPHRNLPLDDLASLARSGDRRAEEGLFDYLRVSFLAVAKRRVRQDDLEDVVQDALRVILDKYREREERGLLSWSFAVLRNVIGNHYQKRAVLDRGLPLEATPDAGATEPGLAGDWTEEIDSNRLLGQVLKGIEILARAHPRCGSLFARVLAIQGLRDLPGAGRGGPVPGFEEMTRGALYVALHRCRARLRAILAEMEGAR